MSVIMTAPWRICFKFLSSFVLVYEWGHWIDTQRARDEDLRKKTIQDELTGAPTLFSIGRIEKGGKSYTN